MIVAVNAFATTRYVSKTGTDSGTCNSQPGCLTINYGIGQMAAADTLIISAGTYSETVTGIPSGTNDSAHTIVQANGAVIITGDVNIFSRNYITFDGFVLDGGIMLIGRALIGDAASTYILIENVEQKNHNDVGGFGGFMPGYLQAGVSSHITILNCIAHDNGTTYIEHGIYVIGRDITIDGGEYYNNAGDGITAYTGSGDTNNAIVRNVKAYDNGNWGLQIWSGSGHLIYNNVLWGNGTDPTYVTGGIEVESDAPKIYNNTIYDSDGYCISLRAGTTNTALVTNNICYVATDGIINVGGGVTATCTYNLGVAGGEGSTNDCTGSSGTDPLFINTTTHDLRITANSPAKDAGTSLSSTFTTDKDGATRPQGLLWDQGAYEISAANPITLVSHTAAASTDGNGVTTTSIDTSGSDLLTVEKVGLIGATDCTLTDSKSNSWTMLTAYSVDSEQRIQMFYSVNPTVGSGHTFTCNGTALAPSIAVQSWSGMAPVPFNVQNGSGNSDVTGIRPGNVTTSTDNELIVTAVSAAPLAIALSIDSGFTKTDETNYSAGLHYGIAAAYKIKSIAGMENPTWTGDATLNYWATDIATFKSGSTFNVTGTPNVFQPRIFTPRIFKTN